MAVFRRMFEQLQLRQPQGARFDSPVSLLGGGLLLAGLLAGMLSQGGMAPVSAQVPVQMTPTPQMTIQMSPKPVFQGGMQATPSVNAPTLKGPMTSMPDGVFLNTNTQQLYSQIGQFESRLYGHAYPDQSISKRVARLERTLFGNAQIGPLELRVAQVVERMKKEKGLESVTSDEATLEYLEHRFFQKTYPQWNPPQRLSQLETYVFGKPSELGSVSQRLKKLTYTVPLNTREIRLTNSQGQVLATTHPKKPPASQVSSSLSGPVTENSTSPPNFPPIKKTTAVLPVAVSDEAPPDYLEAVYRLPRTKRIPRWANLPVMVYVQQGTPEEIMLVHQAVQYWGVACPVKMTAVPTQADVFVDWAGEPPTHLRPLTRLSSTLDSEKNIRTIILVDMSPYHPQGKAEKLRGMIHQLGHATGIWGHSSDPNDVMYPLTAQEATDIPERWNQGIVRFSSTVPEPRTEGIPTRPSLRDKNTMIQVYSAPGEDLRLYSYH